MLASLVLSVAALASSETSFLDKLPPDIAVKSWINTPGWRSLSNLSGKVVLLEFWATW
ncbi:MAG: hypothetical protein U1E76_16960 [Planctomycetota bacterium]